MYLQAAAEPYVQNSDAYFSLSGSKGKWHGTKLTNLKGTTPASSRMLCSEHDAGDASGANGTDGARVEQQELSSR